MSRHVLAAALVAALLPGAALAQAGGTRDSIRPDRGPEQVLDVHPEPDPATDTATDLWLTAGVGVSTVGATSEVASLSFRTRALLISLRTTANQQCDRLFCAGHQIFDTALMAGITQASSDDFARASVSVGLARATGPGDVFSGGPALGFAVDTQVDLPLGRNLGVALLEMYADVNSSKTFGGIVIGLQLGKLR